LLQQNTNLDIQVKGFHTETNSILYTEDVGDWFFQTSWYRTWENVSFWRWCSRWSAPKPVYKYTQNLRADIAPKPVWRVFAWNWFMSVQNC